MNVFTLTEVVYTERAGFMTCTDAGHQGAMKEPQHDV